MNALLAGRDALARGEWEEARARFLEVAAEGERAEALEGLGLAAWWLDDAALTLDSRERAFRAYREAGDALGAARVALWLVWDYVSFRNEFAVADGWLELARRLLEGSAQTSEYGWLLLREGEVALFRHHDTATARAKGIDAAALGRSLGDRGVEMNGLALEGLARVFAGDVEPGMRCLDVASVAATTGDVKELHAVGVVCCWQISACEQIRAYDRAAQWCHRVQEFARRWRYAPLSAVCRSSYAGILTWRGDWVAAEAELERAASDIGSARPATAGQALARLGLLRVLQGRLDEADDLFARSGGHPVAWHGKALLLLERGDAAGAAELVEAFLRHLPAGDRTGRVEALELAARLHAQLGALDVAATRVADLAAIATAVGTEPMRAAVRAAQGALAAARGDHVGAAELYEEAAELYRRTATPFEEARVTLELARALDQTGKRERARTLASGATQALRRLGAIRAAARGDALLKELEAPAKPRASGSKLTERQLEILRLVSQGLSNAEIAGRLRLSEHTVKRHVANLLTRLGLPSRAAAAAYAAKTGLL